MVSPKYKLEDKGLEIKNERLGIIFDLIYSNPKKLIFGFFVTFILIAIGCVNLETNNFFTEEFDKDDPHFKDFMFFEDQMQSP